MSEQTLSLELCPTPIQRAYLTELYPIERQPFTLSNSNSSDSGGMMSEQTLTFELCPIRWTYLTELYPSKPSAFNSVQLQFVGNI